jgi:hypothetical protein
LTRSPFFKPLAASACVLALYLVFLLWSVLQGMAKLPEDARPAPGARGNFEVELRFNPESFHQTRLQALGRLVRVEGKTVLLDDVPRENAITLARTYWVVAIRPQRKP